MVGVGRLRFWQGDAAEAAACLERGVTEARAVGDETSLALAVTWLGAVRVLETRYAEADLLLADGLRRHEAAADQAGTAWALFQLGRAAGNRGGSAGGSLLLEASLARYRSAATVATLLGSVRADLGDRKRSAATVATLLGSVRADLGDRKRSAAALREGLAGLRAVADRAYLLSAQVALPSVAAVTGQLVRAARLFGAAEALQTTIGASLTPINRAICAETLAAIRPHLSPADLDAASYQEQSLTLDQALTEAELVVQAMSAPEPNLPGPTGDSPEPLTRRELQVARLLAAGQTDRQVAAALSIAVTTARVHVHRVLAKLGLRSRWQVTQALRS